MYTLSKNSLKALEGVDGRLQKVVRRALSMSKIDFGIPSTGGLRSDIQQNKLFLAGKSKADGYTHKSRHQPNLKGKSEAVDFYAYVDGKASWEPEHLAQVAATLLQAAIELNIKIKWGGLFRSFTDMPHIELIIKD